MPGFPLSSQVLVIMVFSPSPLLLGQKKKVEGFFTKVQNYYRKNSLKNWLPSPMIKHQNGGRAPGLKVLVIRICIGSLFSISCLDPLNPPILEPAE